MKNLKKKKKKKWNLWAAIPAVMTGLFGAPVIAGDLPELNQELVVGRLSRPIAFIQDPTDPAVQFIVQHRGRILTLVNGVLQTEDFLDITDLVPQTRDGGLLAAAFDPDRRSRRFYLYYLFDDGTEKPDQGRIVRYERDRSNPLRAVPESAEILLEIPRQSDGHHGGNMAFGPDGMLYIGLGDGRLAFEPDHGPQDPFSYLGKFLRIDVSIVQGYQIPADNPFVDGLPVEALPEIWSFGWRNPWRWSFDDVRLGGTGAMVIGDVGRSRWEEFDYEPAGAGGRNYGWPNREGAHNHGNFPVPAYLPLTEPTLEYDHDVGGSITGGIIYRGRRLGDAYQGRYFFADYVTERVWSLGLSIDQNGEATVSDLVEHTEDLGGSDEIGKVTSFGVDACGELYLVTFSPQTVKRVVAEQSPVATIEEITMQSGVKLRGGIEHLCCPDDHELHARSGLGDTFTELHVMRMLIRALSAVDNPRSMDIAIKWRIDEPDGQGTVSLRNFRTSEFDHVGSFPIGLNDETVTIESIDAADYVRDDGRITLAINHVVFVPFIAFTFESFIDLVEIVVE